MIERETEQEGDNTHIGSMQLLNALKTKQTKKQPQSKGLMYVEAQVNGMFAKAMIDTDATHNFVSEGEARRLKLKISTEAGWLKAVNSAAKPSQGVARGVTSPNTCLDPMPRLSANTSLGKMPWPNACLDTVTRPSTCLDTVPQPSAMTCLRKKPRPSACLEIVPRSSAMTCLDKVPRSIAFLDTVPQPSAMTCLNKVPQSSVMPRNSASA